MDRKISFDAHKQSINASAKELKRSLRSDWHDGYEDQVELKGQIVGEVDTWLNSLFKVAIEDSLELAIVQKCLIFMEGHVIAMMSDNCRTDYSDCYDCFESTISDSTGDSRYQGMSDSLIPYFWRDLLLMAIAQGDKTVLTNFKAHKDAAKPRSKPFGPSNYLDRLASSHTWPRA